MLFGNYDEAHLPSSYLINISPNIGICYDSVILILEYFIIKVKRRPMCENFSIPLSSLHFTHSGKNPAHSTMCSLAGLIVDIAYTLHILLLKCNCIIHITLYFSLTISLRYPSVSVYGCTSLMALQY